MHSGDSGCSLPPNSLSAETQAELKEQTRKLARALKVVGLMNIQFAIQNGVVYILEVNPRASRTVPFVSKATGVPLAKMAARVMAGAKLKELGLTSERVPQVLRGQGIGVPVREVPGGRSDSRPGDEIDRRSDGHRAVVRRGVCEGAARLRRHAADARRVPDQRARTRQARGGDARAATGGAGLRDRRDVGHREGDYGRGNSLPQRQQGARRSPAHRRHDQERRDLADREHDRRQAGDFRVALDPSRGGAQARHVLHDRRRGARDLRCDRTHE